MLIPHCKGEGEDGHREGEGEEEVKGGGGRRKVCCNGKAEHAYASSQQNFPGTDVNYTFSNEGKIQIHETDWTSGANAEQQVSEQPQTPYTPKVQSAIQPKAARHFEML